MCFNKFKLIGALLILCSCSVLEDRGLCPRLLHIDLSARENYICDSVEVRLYSTEGRLWRGTVSRNEYEKGLDVRFECRGDFFINVMDKRITALSDVDTDAGLEIVSGGQCPEAYMHFIPCLNDRMELAQKVSISKNYCTVSMDFLAEDLDKYIIDVQGDISGYSLDGAPCGGEFSYRPEIGSARNCSFRVPRQVDASLRLGIRPKDGGDAHYFALGSYIGQSGYDWSKKDLDDICISIDYSATRFVIQINGWEYCDDFQVEM